MSLTNASSLKALEWASICALLVHRATRSVNRLAFETFLPDESHRTQIEGQIGQVETFRTLLDDGTLRFESIPEVDEICGALSIQGEYLDGIDLVALARFAEGSAELGRDVKARLERQLDSIPHVSPPKRRILSGWAISPSSPRWRTAIGPKGEVRDDASPELRRLRARTHRLREDLELVFDTYLHKPNADDVLQDKVVANRNGRSVLMVKAEAKRSFEGVVHGASRAQKTAFIEPIEAVAVNNELVVVSEEEQEEIRQILRRLSEEARQDLSALKRAGWILQHVGRAARQSPPRSAISTAARRSSRTTAPSRSSVAFIRCSWSACAPTSTLLPSGREPVPLDLAIDATSQILVIGGPNTGGKTVALKSVGLLCLMARSGLPIPAAEGTVVPFFDSIFAEIGDDQSLGAGLSTFSAQIAGIAKMTVGEGEALAGSARRAGIGHRSRSKAARWAPR
jgi:DNA mismatch repair protein MutS2